MNIYRRILSLLGCLLVVFTCMAPSAFAETSLPDGAVKGLPERLAALDDEGRAVNSETGEYFFRVEDMVLGETYTKNIQLMNLYENRIYNIYFCVEPLFKNGEIDLEKGCICRFYLDGEEFYSGDVNGAGNIDLTEYYDLGEYDPGESHILRCEIMFNELAINKEIDNGWRVVDIDGVHVLRGPNDSGHAYGEIEFKWIFVAQNVRIDGSHTSIPGTDDDGDGGSGGGGGSSGDGSGGSGDGSGGGGTLFPPRTGILLNDGRVWLVCIAVIALMIAVLLVLIWKQKKQQSPQKRENHNETGKQM